MTESEMIDHILEETQIGYDIGGVDNADLTLYYTTLRKMVALGLIKQENYPRVMTSIGLEVMEADGYANWVRLNKIRETQQAWEKHQATMSNRSTVRASWVSAIFAGVAAIAAIGIPIYQSWQGDEKVNRLNERVEKLESLMKAQSQNQTSTAPNSYSAASDSARQSRPKPAGSR